MASKITSNYLPEIFALGYRRNKPSMVTVNLTNRCNQKCVYCEIGTSNLPLKDDKLTVDDLFWIIDEMAINNIRKLSLCGGEPLLFKGLFDVVAYAGEKNIRCSITTNGMTAFRIDEFNVQKLKACKTEINISIDSFSDDIQTLTRGTTAALPNALKSVKFLSEKGIPVTVLTAISKYNYHDLFGFLAHAWELGIKQVLFQPIIYFSNYPDRPAIDEKSQLNVSEDNLGAMVDQLNKILHFERNHNIKTNVYRILPWIEQYLKTAANPHRNWFFNEVLQKFYCREIFAIIDISYDGGIQPCGLLSASVSIFENRNQGLMELWEKATVQIKVDLAEDKYYEICNGCCHHFSRNMLASIMKYPYKNREALFKMLPLLFSRMMWRIWKKINTPFK